MTPETVMTIGKQAVQVVLLLTAIILIPGLIAGLIVSMVQAATSINEATLSFIPKLMVTFSVLLVAGNWMLRIVIDYITTLYRDIPFLIG